MMQCRKNLNLNVVDAYDSLSEAVVPGAIKSYIHTGNQIGALVELNCQSKVTALLS